VVVLDNRRKAFRKRWSVLVIFASIILFCAIGLTFKVFANNGGNSGTGSGASGGSCAPSGSTRYWDTCYGVTWRKYPAASDNITVAGSSNTPGGTIKNCKTYGGYYYRLAFEVYNPSTMTSYNEQKGLVPVNKVTSNFDGGSGFYNFRIVGDSEKWEDVQHNFELAQNWFKKLGLTDFPTDWKDTAWFCWDITLENPQMQFQSKSQVSSASGSTTSPSWDANAPDLEVQADADGKATVTFSHQLHYEAGNHTDEYENASTSWTITTDTVNGNQTGTWSTPGKTSADSSWLPENNPIQVQVTLGNGETEKKVCSKIKYTTKTVKWDDSNPHKMIPAGDNGETTACAVVKKDQTVTQTSGDILFWPQSSVESVAEKDVVNHKEWTTDDKNNADGDKVSMQLSTDYATAKANFQHKLHVEVNMSYTFGTNDTWDSTNMCSNYTITLAGGGTKTGKLCAPSPSAGSSTSSGVETIDGDQGHVINVPGSAIEKIEYDNKTISISRSEITYTGTCGTSPNTYSCQKSYDPKRWKYYGSGGSGSGNSSAEIEYVSPNEPDDSKGPSSGSGSSGEPMYAGESTGMTWWAKAEAINTRRIIEYQSIAFEVQNTVGYSADKVKGVLGEDRKYNGSPDRDRNDPCAYWQSKLSPFRTSNGGCAQVDAGSQELNGNFSVGYVGLHEVPSIYRSMVIPDYVGDKYCNSFGYKWQYYWGLKRTSDGGQWVYSPDPLTYWTHYDAACRTIAKRPSMAVWNGGVFANNSIVTSLASRHDNTAVGTIRSADPNASFGSWTEHLGVAGGVISSFGTGGSLSFGSGTIGVSVGRNSPLTIRNNASPLGMSGIPANPTLISRLQNYVGDLPGVTINYSGDVSISSDIVSSNTSYSDIYELPQTIIYAPEAKKVNISSGVTRIDAWIIAPIATVDTCSDFQAKSTETRPDSAHTCDNPLQINGPVIAKNIKLNRTGGADITNDGSHYTTLFQSIYSDDWQKYTPAEVFNLSADAYLWSYAQAGRYGSSYSEAYSRELPPRY